MRYGQPKFLARVEESDSAQNQLKIVGDRTQSGIGRHVRGPPTCAGRAAILGKRNSFDSCVPTDRDENMAGGWEVHVEVPGDGLQVWFAVLAHQADAATQVAKKAGVGDERVRVIGVLSEMQIRNLGMRRGEVGRIDVAPREPR
jgi:hypothetical protein